MKVTLEIEQAKLAHLLAAAITGIVLGRKEAGGAVRGRDLELAQLNNKLMDFTGDHPKGCRCGSELETFLIEQSQLLLGISSTSTPTMPGPVLRA